MSSSFKDIVKSSHTQTGGARILASAAVLTLVSLTLAGCAVYEPYPAYPGDYYSGPPNYYAQPGVFVEPPPVVFNFGDRGFRSPHRHRFRHY